ncbi:MAG: glucose 1-dehydrogenase [Actinobacteria bacterium]|nr:glucose 1-dehydrogenase [Actinomycetota bacterium]
MSTSRFSLHGKVAVVTGGNGGIGLGCALGLAEAGADISIWARDIAKGVAAIAEIEARGGRAKFYQVDVTDRIQIDAAVQDTIAEFDGIDILVANAGMNLRKRPEDFSLEEMQQMWNVNISSPFECAQAVYAEMKRRGGGKIITIGSVTSVFGFGVSPAYSASKGAIVQLTKSLASAWGADNIQVNSILPGWIETEMTVQTRGIPGVNEQIASRTPAGRWGTPDDLVGAAIFLSSRASDYVTGIALPVDGGFISTLFQVDPPTD